MNIHPSYSPTHVLPERITAYGSRVVAVEPTGAEPIPAEARHGRPIQLLSTWVSPNMEFATVFIGVLAVAYLGLGFWPTLAALALGNALGSLSQGVLSTCGPRFGVPQMVASRSAFGYLGNILPVGVNTLTAGIGWFAVNSLSTAFALSTLLGWKPTLCLVLAAAVQIAIAFLGYNFIHLVEKYTFPVLSLLFLIGAVAVFQKSGLPHGPASTSFNSGSFLIITSAAFGYASGWNPFASDYSRYLPREAPRRRVALWPALGVFVSCTLLGAVGAAACTIASIKPDAWFANPTTAFTSAMNSTVGDLVLIAIAIGGTAANALNIYSGTMSFASLDLRLPSAFRRNLITLISGIIATVVGYFGLNDAGQKYNDFLLVLAYWTACWLAVVFTDLYRRRREPDDAVGALQQDRSFRLWAGPAAMLIGTALSIYLFSNESDYVGVIAAKHPAIGDVTPLAGFALTAALYLVLAKLPGFRPNREIDTARHAKQTVAV